jgi:RimJ/RimL family protein N-acetyltransferase
MLILETKNLTFKHLVPDDLDTAFALYRNPEVQRYFPQLGLRRLICLIDEANQASIRVAEKIGMTFEKEGRDELGPFHLYALNRERTA